MSPAALAAPKSAPAGEPLGPNKLKRPWSTSPHHNDNVSVSYDINGDREHLDFTSISSIWDPIAAMWPWKNKEGRKMVGIEFVFPAGSSQGDRNHGN